jgi:hypothetical protein
MSKLFRTFVKNARRLSMRCTTDSNKFPKEFQIKPIIKVVEGLITVRA